MESLTVTAREGGQRIDKFLKKYLNEAPPSFVYKMLRKKNITLNGKRADGSERIGEGDVICLYLSEETIAKFRSGQEYGSGRPHFPEVIYEDEDVLFLNKPPGLLTQPAKRGDLSVASLLPDYLAREGKLEAGELRAFRPAPLNRLDRNTSGLVLCGTSLRGSQELAALIAGRGVRKEYLVIAAGEPSPGIYRAFGRKDAQKNQMMVSDRPEAGARQMLTGISVLAHRGAYSLLRVELITGRSHQIRAHLAFLGCPVAGDPKYGSRALNLALREQHHIARQMLHAERVTFPADCGTLEQLAGKQFKAAVPEDMQRFIRQELKADYGDVEIERAPGFDAGGADQPDN